MSKAIGRTCKQLLSTLGNENRNEWHFENGLTVIAE